MLLPTETAVQQLPSAGSGPSGPPNNFMVPKRPKFGLFFEKFSLVVCLLCTPTNWPKTGGQIWGPSAFKTRQNVW